MMRRLLYLSPSSFEQIMIERMQQEDTMSIDEPPHDHTAAAKASQPARLVPRSY